MFVSFEENRDLFGNKYLKPYIFDRRISDEDFYFPDSYYLEIKSIVSNYELFRFKDISDFKKALLKAGLEEFLI
jgi:hypothetical protein